MLGVCTQQVLLSSRWVSRLIPQVIQDLRKLINIILILLKNRYYDNQNNANCDLHFCPRWPQIVEYYSSVLNFWKYTPLIAINVILSSCWQKLHANVRHLDRDYSQVNIGMAVDRSEFSWLSEAIVRSLKSYRVPVCKSVAAELLTEEVTDI